MTIYRVEHCKNYTTINNTICKDKNLSWKAKGIWLYAFSRPDDWSFHINDLANQSTDGKDAVQAGLKELEKYGYLVRVQKRDENKKFMSYEWTFFETPREIKEILPQRDFPVPAFPVPENPPLLSTDCLPSTEEEQQQAAPAVVVFSILEKVEIPLGEKSWLSKTYDENTIQQAVAFATHPKTVISTSLVQVIKWACKKIKDGEPPEIPKDLEEIEAKNKAFAEKCRSEAIISSASYFEVLNNSVEIGHYGQAIPTQILYLDKAFEETLKSTLRKHQILKKKTK